MVISVTLSGVGAGAELPIALITITEILDEKDRWIAIILNVFCPFMSAMLTSVYFTISVFTTEDYNILIKANCCLLVMIGLNLFARFYILESPEY
jgi:MFS family permease